MIEEIFSIQIYRGKISVSEQEYSFIVNLKRLPNQYMNEVSENTFVLNSPELKNLKYQCEQHFKIYLTDIMGIDMCDLVLTQSWVNYNKRGSSHHTHNHVNSIVSAVLYLTENPSRLVMFRDKKEIFEPVVNRINKYNNDTHSLNVSKNDIILFPSFVRHGVKLNEQTHERISLAMNSFYSGVLGNEQELTYLRIQ